jgi:hypothetical protein
MNTLQMVARRFAFALLLTVGLTSLGCAGEMVPLGGGSSTGDDDSTVGDDDSTPPPPQADAGTPPQGQTPEELFTSTVKPLFTACNACHQGTAPPNGWLGTAATMYETIKASNVISISSPASSTLVTHVHSAAGYPELDDAGHAAVTAWITAEAGQ